MPDSPGLGEMPGEERLIALEERIAWLEMLLHNQGAEISALTNRLDDAIRLLKYLSSKTADPYAVRPQSEEEPPPHY